MLIYHGDDMNEIQVTPDIKWVVAPEQPSYPTPVNTGVTFTTEFARWQREQASHQRFVEQIKQQQNEMRMMSEMLAARPMCSPSREGIVSARVAAPKFRYSLFDFFKEMYHEIF